MKLKKKLTYRIIVVGFLAILLMLLIHNFHFKKVYIENNKQDMKNLAVNYSLNLDKEIKEIIARVETISKSPIIKESLETSNANYQNMNELTRKSIINLLNEKWMLLKKNDHPFIERYTKNKVANYFSDLYQSDSDFFGEIFLTNKYGVLVASTGKLTTLAHSHKYWWQGSYKNYGTIYLDDRGYDSSVEGYVLGIVVPIKKDDIIIGILKCNVNIKGLLSNLEENYSYSYMVGNLKIVRSGGYIVYEKDKEPLSTEVNQKVLNKLDNDNNSYIVNVDGEEKIFSSANVNITNGNNRIKFGGNTVSIHQKKGNKDETWNVLITADLDEKLGDFYEIRRVLIYSGIIIVIFLSLLSIKFGKELAKPLIELASIATSLGKGNLDKKINMKRNDEIGILADSFNKMQKDLKKSLISKERLEKILEKTPDGYWMINKYAYITDVNESYANMVGYTQRELMGMHISELEIIDDKEDIDKRMLKIQKEEYAKFETKHKKKDGKIIDIEVSALYLELEEPYYVVFMRDITTRKKEEDFMRYLSYHDQMTDLYNRAYFEKEMERLNHSRRLPISIVIGDLDGLKTINDNLGHAKGDEYIIIVAEILQSITRKEDIVARLGGDEFGILLPETDAKETELICNRIKDKCRTYTEENNLKIDLSISLGYKVINKTYEELFEAKRIADKNMYKDKNNKKL